MSNYKNDCTDCTNNFVNDLKEFNKTCLNFGYIQGTLEATSPDVDAKVICRQMFSDGLDFMFNTFCRLHNIVETKDEPKDETKDETKDEFKDETKEGIEDDVEKYEGMYNYDDSITEKLLEDMLKETENEDNN